MNFKLVYSSVILAFLYLATSYIYVHQLYSSLTNQKFKEISHEMKTNVETLIHEKQEAITLVSLALATSENIQHVLLKKHENNFDYSSLSLKLKQETSLKSIWFQILDAKGNSFYRSWTDKTGDSLLDARIDVAQMIKNPHVISGISAGKFDITFKSMVPIYDNNNFLGVIETIAKFDSVATKMKKRDVETLIIVNDKYKDQLTEVEKKRFVENYYIANQEPNKELLGMLKSARVKDYINIEGLIVDKEKNIILTVYELKDMNNEVMAHLLMSKKLSNIDMRQIELSVEKIITVLAIVFVILVLLVYYFYTRNYKKFIQKQNEKLEESVNVKTKELQRLANYDALTGLPNRLLFLDRLKQHLKHATRDEESVSILFLDLDRFKEVNDTYGHNMGDALLKHVAVRLIDSVRDEDTISRLGGDEFTIILHNTDNEDMIKVANKIQRKMQEKFVIDGIELSTTFSIGISVFPKDGITSELLIRNADTAMYKAKEAGKNGYQFYNSQMTELAFARIELEKSISDALKLKQFKPYFQVKVDAQDKSVVGFEALIRWIHPTKGIIPPDDFIPFAEEIGIIVDINKFMMQESMIIFKRFKAKGLKCGMLSVNVSSEQLGDYSYVEDVEECLKNTGFDAKDLDIEILEGQNIENKNRVAEILRSLKGLGTTMSIDDFGTGYSSLTYLKKLPIDNLKIDRSFVRDIPKNKDDMSLVQTIIALARSLHLKVIAEGVETKEQAEFLKKSGCNVLQGYYFSRPIPEHECEIYLKAKS
ncbi:EAL domain-containing protein [Sulfurimonas aquatica]|uniref:EAL domain-containing protein n=1 Tax=Sulfurimonas aquatica TaxID=2672570 RepID=A0A975GD73_9BACT|nr:EAL domain-containing protein [Sulfurimonas aquatica]QSZ42053.1 EAL domain-containing protein [Sulfurimonas aquatica]